MIINNIKQCLVIFGKKNPLVDIFKKSISITRKCYREIFILFHIYKSMLFLFCFVTFSIFFQQ